MRGRARRCHATVPRTRGSEVRVQNAQCDLETAEEIAKKSPGWAFTIAYDATHLAGRSFLLLRGYRTVGEGHYAAVVNFLELGSSELIVIYRIWEYVKGASLADHCFGNVGNLRNAVASVFDELNRSDNHELAPCFRGLSSKGLLRAA